MHEFATNVGSPSPAPGRGGRDTNQGATEPVVSSQKAKLAGLLFGGGGGADAKRTKAPTQRVRLCCSFNILRLFGQRKSAVIKWLRNHAR